MYSRFCVAQYGLVKCADFSIALWNINVLISLRHFMRYCSSNKYPFQFENNLTFFIISHIVISYCEFKPLTNIECFLCTV